MKIRFVVTGKNYQEIWDAAVKKGVEFTGFGISAFDSTSINPISMDIDASPLFPGSLVWVAEVTCDV